MFFILFINCLYGQTIYIQELGPIVSKEIEIYGNMEYNSSFAITEKSCCTPPPLYVLNITDNQNQRAIIKSDNIAIYSHSISSTSDGSGIYINAKYLSDSSIEMYMSCKNNIPKNSGLQYFSFEGLDLINNQNMTFQFAFWQQCDSFSQFRFDWSLIFIVLLGCLVVFSYASLLRIVSVQIPLKSIQNKTWLYQWLAAQNYQSQDSYPTYFQGFRVNIWYMLIYLLLSLIFYIIVIAFNDWYWIVMGFCLLIGFLLGIFWLNEIQFKMRSSWGLRKQIFYFVRVCDLISVALIVIIEFFYIHLEQPWYLGNIIVYFIAGSTVKLFKFTNLKSATLLLSAGLFFDLIYYTILNVKNIDYQTDVLIYSNYPVQFQLPLFKYSYDRVCCWLSIFDVILPGMIIIYLNRYDKNKNQIIYFSIGILGFGFGIILWIICVIYASLIQLQLPQSLFVNPLMISSIVLWANKQGELRILWDGLFYDKFLMSDQIEKLNIDEQQIQEQVYEELILK